MAKKRLGNQNPTQSVILPYTESLSDEAIAIYEKTGLKSYPWQKNLVKSIMAVDDDGLWVHQKFGFSIPRRNGKTEIIYILELWGLKHGLNMLHTAHRISTSHSSFEKVKKYLEKMGMKDGEDFNSIRAKGQERIELYETGGIIQFRTRTSNGGLGEGFDFLVIDEAQEYTTEQESALKYTVTDSENPMTVMCGTPPTPVSKLSDACFNEDKILFERLSLAYFHGTKTAFEKCSGRTAFSLVAGFAFDGFMDSGEHPSFTKKIKNQ